MQIGAVDSWGENCFNEYVWPRRHVHPKVLVLVLIFGSAMIPTGHLDQQFLHEAKQSVPPWGKGDYSCHQKRPSSFQLLVSSEAPIIFSIGCLSWLGGCPGSISGMVGGRLDHIFYDAYLIVLIILKPGARWWCGPGGTQMSWLWCKGDFAYENRCTISIITLLK